MVSLLVFLAFLRAVSELKLLKTEGIANICHADFAKFRQDFVTLCVLIESMNRRNYEDC